MSRKYPKTRRGGKTGRAKVLDVERQIHAMLNGEQTDFCCPFCDQITTENNGILCCDETADVVNAILDYIEHLKACQIADQIMDRFSAAESKLIFN